MAVSDYIIFSLALWIVISAIFSPSTDIFLTLVLIGVLIVLEVGEFYLAKETREDLKYSAYFLLLVFSVIVMLKIYGIIR